MTETTEEFDQFADVERRLAEADAGFERGPVERARAIDAYASLADWIDPRTEVGARRVARVLSDPHQLDAAMQPLLARAADSCPEPSVRLGARFAAARFAIASREYLRAETAVLRSIREHRDVFAGEPVAAYGTLVIVYALCGREHEALAALRRVETTGPGEGELGAVAVAFFRCRVRRELGALRDSLRAVGDLVRARVGMSVGITAGYAARAGTAGASNLAELGRPEDARRVLATVDTSSVCEAESRFLESSLTLAKARVALSSGEPEEAAAICAELRARPSADPRHAAESLVVSARASLALGRPAEAVVHSAELVARVRTTGDSLGTGAALRACGAAAEIVQPLEGSALVVRELLAASLDLRALRVDEVAAFARRDAGFSELTPDDRAQALAFRRRFAVLPEALDPFARADLAAERARFAERVAARLGPAPSLSSCASCLAFRDGDGREYPVAHLTGAAFAATIPAASCDGCATPPV